MPACPRSVGPSRGLAFSLALRAAEKIQSPRVDAGFQCAACGEWNQTTVDESAGTEQCYVEDCQVCCKPNILRIRYDSPGQGFEVTAELE